MNNKNYLYIKKTVDLIVKNYQNIILMQEPMKIQFISTRFNSSHSYCVRKSFMTRKNVQQW